MSSIRALAVSIFAALVVTSSATAQTYPNRPVTLLVAAQTTQQRAFFRIQCRKR
jgi:hypothetical protein